MEKALAAWLLLIGTSGGDPATPAPARTPKAVEAKAAEARAPRASERLRELALIRMPARQRGATSKPAPASSALPR
jgi:hypothetical protein